jgi:hypothetical protein
MTILIRMIKNNHKINNKEIIISTMGILIIKLKNKIKIKDNLQFFKGKAYKLDDISLKSKNILFNLFFK